MVESTVYIGHHCPRCNTTVGMYTAIGGPGACPTCGGPLQAAPGGPKTTATANAHCKSCGFRAGMYVSVGGAQSKCPKCGSPM
jgi:DNA-directed RNA polymerase subunit RPC12/RpoP